MQRSRLPLILLAVLLAAVGCTTVRDHAFLPVGKLPDTTRWRMFFPYRIQVLDERFRPGAPADTLVFHPYAPQNDYTLWPGEDAEPGGSFRVRYVLMSAVHAIADEQTVVFGGEGRTFGPNDRPRVALGIDKREREILLQAIFERVMPDGEIVPGRILEGRFERRDETSTTLHYK